MAQGTRERRQASLTLNAPSTKYTQTLSRGMLYREIYLRLVGSITFAAAASNVGAGMNRGDEWGIIEKVEIIGNGTDVIRSMSGPELKFLNRLWFGTLPRPATTYGDGAATAGAFDSTLVIPFWNFLSAKPMDTILDSSKYSDLRIEITTSPFANLNTVAPTAFNATLDICSYESFGVTGDFSDMKIYPIRAASPGANQAFQMLLPVNSVYRGFAINAANGFAVNSTDGAALITNVRLVSGTTVFRDIPFRVLTDSQRQRLGWVREVSQNVAATAPISAAGTLLNAGKSTLCNEDAWAFLDLCKDGFITEGIDTVGYSEIYLEFNVSAAASITVFPIQIFPIRRNG